MKYLFILLMALLVFAGCKKNRFESDIVGDWRVVPFTPPEGVDTIIWQFDGANILRRYTLHNSGQPNDTLINTYSLMNDIRFIYLVIDVPEGHIFLPAHDQEGKYRIDYLKNGILKITRVNMPDGSTEAAYMRFEFKQYIPPSAKK